MSNLQQLRDVLSSDLRQQIGYYKVVTNEVSEFIDYLFEKSVQLCQKGQLEQKHGEGRRPKEEREDIEAVVGEYYKRNPERMFDLLIDPTINEKEHFKNHVCRCVHGLTMELETCYIHLLRDKNLKEGVGKPVKERGQSIKTWKE